MTLHLHYWPTPNGKKVTIFLEETDLDYNVVPCNIGRGDQFEAEFLKLNPNNRMPVNVASGGNRAACEAPI
jgi:GSH-dependent disulfide-bond oxidoreductase